MGTEKELAKPTAPTNPKPKKAKKGCRLTKTTMLIIIISMTSAFFLVELVVGHITKSNALTADAFHMLSDLIALVYCKYCNLFKLFQHFIFIDNWSCCCSFLKKSFIRKKHIRMGSR